MQIVNATYSLKYGLVGLRGLAGAGVFRSGLRVVLSPLGSPVLRECSGGPGVCPGVSGCSAGGVAVVCIYVPILPSLHL